MAPLHTCCPGSIQVGGVRIMRVGDIAELARAYLNHVQPIVRRNLLLQARITAFPGKNGDNKCSSQTYSFWCLSVLNNCQHVGAKRQDCCWRHLYRFHLKLEPWLPPSYRPESRPSVKMSYHRSSRQTKAMYHKRNSDGFGRLV